MSILTLAAKAVSAVRCDDMATTSIWRVKGWLGKVVIYAAVCLEGAIIVLACIIFSLFAASPPTIDPNAAAVSMVWSYIGELVFNMLVLVGAVKMADRVVREMMGL